MKDQPYWQPSPMCRVCENPSIEGSYLCGRCKKVLNRVETRKGPTGKGRRVNRMARLEAMRRQWNAHVGAFMCHYTGLPMTEEYGTTRFATWEHLTPGNEGSVVLVTDLVNRMKADMTDAEFRRMVRALAQHFDKGIFDEWSFPDRSRRVIS